MDLTHENPALRRLDFDQWQRYGAVALLLKPLLAELDRPARVLEIGCNVLNLLPEFLEPLAIDLTRCDVADLGDDAPDFVLIPREGPLPFADDQFDFVIALEVLEHIPAEDRLYTLGEWNRVAARGLILTCPDGSTGVRSAEAVARAAYEERNGKPHPWLTEHLEYDLPQRDSLRSLLDELGLEHTVLGNSPLDEWLPLLVLTEELTETGAPHTVVRFNEWLNGRPQKAFTDREPYRQIIACFKNRTAARRAATCWRAILTDHSEPERSPTLDLVDRLRELLQPQVAAWEREAQMQHLRGRSHAQALRLAEEQAHTQALEHRLRRQQLTIEAQGRGGQRLTAGQHLQFSALRDVQAPVHDEPDLWESLGADPQIHRIESLPPGWIRLRVSGQMPAGSVSKLYYDDGTGFREDQCLLIGPWNGPQTWTRLHYFHHGVRAWRFDPLAAPGPFRLHELVVSPLSTRAVMAHSFGVHLGEWLHPRRWFMKPLKLVRVLLREGVAGLRRRLVNRLQVEDQAAVATLDPPPHYPEWARRHALTESQRSQLRAVLQEVSAPPRLGLAVAIPAFDEEALERTLASVALQEYEHFELTIAVTDSGAAVCRQVLNRHPRLHERTVLVAVPPPCRASELLNRLLQQPALDYLIPLDAGDQLTSVALLELAACIAQQPGQDVYYSDEDHWREGGGIAQPVAPYLKPDWSPETYLAQPYLGRLSAFDLRRCVELGGFLPQFEGAHEYDFILRLMASGPLHIRHLQRVLYQRTGFPPRPHVLTKPMQRVLHHQAKSLGLDRSKGGDGPRFAVDPATAVSIVIPTAGKAACLRGKSTHFVRHCVQSIRLHTSHEHYEIIVVDNGDLAPDVVRELDLLGVRRVTFDAPFNLAAKLNLGVKHARGEYLVLLNDDTEVITPDWLESMLEYATQPAIGAVGAKLFFPDGRLQHVGVVLLDGNPGHPWYAAPGGHEGYFRSTAFPRNYLAVTGACLMTRRSVFDEVGGFDLRFPLNYNDVDYCLRLRRRGLRSVWTPHAQLYHHEAVSKEGGATVRPEELALFRQLWAEHYPVDPYYHPLLSQRHCDYRLRAD